MRSRLSLRHLNATIFDTSIKHIDIHTRSLTDQAQRPDARRLRDLSLLQMTPVSRCVLLRVLRKRRMQAKFLSRQVALLLIPAIASWHKSTLLHSMAKDPVSARFWAGLYAMRRSRTPGVPQANEPWIHLATLVATG